MKEGQRIVCKRLLHCRVEPALLGTYLYADLCSGEMFGLAQVTPGVWQSTLLLSSGLSPLSFGQDVQHELYLGSSAGTVYQIGLGQ